MVLLLEICIKNGQSFAIANVIGETDLITCPHGCTIPGGFYALTEPREQKQGLCYAIVSV